MICIYKYIYFVFFARSLSDIINYYIFNVHESIRVTYFTQKIEKKGKFYFAFSLFFGAFFHRCYRRAFNPRILRYNNRSVRETFVVQKSLRAKMQSTLTILDGLES